MNDEQVQSLLDSWFRDRDQAPRDAGGGVSRVMAMVPQVRQRNRRWAFPDVYLKTSSPNAIEYPPGPIPASDGHTPTVTGRTQPMFSPAKAITAAALVVGIGGAFLIARPFQHQSTVPAAEVQPPPAPTAFSATYIWSDRSNPGSTTEYDDGTIASVGQGWMFDSQESSDPRFAGPLVLTVTDITYPDVGGGISVGGYRIETDEGAWQQVPGATPWYEEGRALWASGELPPPDNIQFYTFIGEGAYEGLTAVVQETWFPGGAEGLVQFDGSIFEGDLPAAPEAWVP
jgi:hypothetical protein